MGLVIIEEQVVEEQVVEEQAEYRSAMQHSNLEAQRALHQARLEAQRRGSQEITVADLLAGIGWEEGTRADRIAGLKTNSIYLRWLLALPPLPAAHPCDAKVQPEPDPGARMALAYARAEADRDGEVEIHSDHLLRGLLRFPNIAHFALLKTDVNLQSARLASKRDRAEYLPSNAPMLVRYQYIVRRSLTRWAPSVLDIGCYLFLIVQGISLSNSPHWK